MDNKLQTTAQIKDGVITVNKKKMTGSTLFHEVAHPFIEMIKRTNPSLFNSLVNEALNSKQGQDIMRKVEQSNTYKNSTQGG